MSDLLKDLFEYFSEEHDLILTQSEIQDIIYIVLKEQQKCKQLE